MYLANKLCHVPDYFQLVKGSEALQVWGLGMDQRGLRGWLSWWLASYSTASV